MVTLTAFAVFTSSLARANAADSVPGVSDTEVVLGGTHPL